MKGVCAAGLALVCATGCVDAQRVACKVIDTAHDVCVVLKYTRPDGSTDRVQVPAQSLSHYALAASTGRSVVVSTEKCR